MSPAVAVGFERLCGWQELAGEKRTRDLDRRTASHPPQLVAGTEVFDVVLSDRGSPHPC